jgi:hypothetical protein
MKSLPNSTNGVIVLSDSFATSIFKQSFLRVFNKDDQGHLQMGFNATFDVQVRFFSQVQAYVSNYLSLFPVHERAQSLWYDWPRHLRWQKITLRWRDRDRYWPDLCLENQRPLTTNRYRRLLRSRHPRRPTPLPWLPRPHPICHSLLARLWANASALDYCHAQLR